jgi:hypothetical protein
VGETLHQIDERVAIADIHGLQRIYEAVIDRFFAPAADADADTDTDTDAGVGRTAGRGAA